MTAIDNIPARVQRVRACRFIEDGSTGPYEWAPVVPAYAIIDDLGVIAEALWDDGTSAAIEVGISGGDEDYFLASINLKATDLTAGQSVSLLRPGGLGGVALPVDFAAADLNATFSDTEVEADFAKVGAVLNGHVLGRYDTSDRTLSFTITVGGADGSAGRTVAYVSYLVPVLEAADVTA